MTQNLTQGSSEDWQIVGFGQELKKMWNMKVAVAPLVVGAVGNPAKALEKGLNTKKT